MPIRQRFDRLLLGAAILLTAVGLAILASASWLIATERYGRPGSYFFTWQAATAMIGLGLLVVCMHLRKSLLVDRRLVIGAAGCRLGLAVGRICYRAPVAATHRWVSIGGISAAAVGAGAPRSDHGDGDPARARPAGRVGRGRNWQWSAGFRCDHSGDRVQPDLGSAALLVVVLGAMAFVSGMPMRLLALRRSSVRWSLVVAIVTSPYRLARVRAFFDSRHGRGGAAGRATRAWSRSAAVGFLGLGYGSGLQKLFFLPEPHTDFIFSITGEELGLVGLMVLLGLAGVIAWRGFVIAARLEDPQRALLAFGITVAFAVQSLVHMVVCLDLLPPKGIPLPFVSYGKTEMVVTLVSVGILLNLSREVKA